MEERRRRMMERVVDERAERRLSRAVRSGREWCPPHERNRGKEKHWQEKNVLMLQNTNTNTHA